MAEKLLKWWDKNLKENLKIYQNLAPICELFKKHENGGKTFEIKNGKIITINNVLGLESPSRNGSGPEMAPVQNRLDILELVPKSKFSH